MHTASIVTNRFCFVANDACVIRITFVPLTKQGGAVTDPSISVATSICLVVTASRAVANEVRFVMTAASFLPQRL
jgi:hypothetical protein